jgi:hypothetical protein
MGCGWVVEGREAANEEMEVPEDEEAANEAAWTATRSAAKTTYFVLSN